MTQRSNIALIGMAGVGKSYIGKALADRLSLDFVDTDDLVLARSGLVTTIGELPTAIGDKQFLALENETRHELARLTNTVIATGGSYVYLPDAMEALRATALVVFLLDTFKVIEQRAQLRGPEYQLIGQGTLSLLELFIDRNKRARHYAHLIVNIPAMGRDLTRILDTIIAHHSTLAA